MSIKETIKHYIRVMRIARKPSKEEFVNTGKVCALGIGIIGVIGFAIFIAFVLLLPWL
ncbi:MAG: protein translocase SEC61 complex subunit gamma [Nanoarchaeota archaeon]|nr:protein translocase SEC61 complex subunit gamma [Nanoarchaeota archaeon]MBU1135172.1 protein translocase SEC61 complex subunit gamma [Nanoarchaeota archaeon]MBU2520525.1 protein translocase SEC61 complex subunit gamma [Nanoarchaeota archaeon]